MCTDISADMSADIAVCCRPSLDQYLTDTQPTYLPCIDRVSIETSTNILIDVSTDVSVEVPIRYMIQIVCLNLLFWIVDSMLFDIKVVSSSVPHVHLDVCSGFILHTIIKK